MFTTLHGNACVTTNNQLAAAAQEEVFRVTRTRNFKKQIRNLLGRQENTPQLSGGLG